MGIVGFLAGDVLPPWEGFPSPAGGSVLRTALYAKSLLVDLCEHVFGYWNCRLKSREVLGISSAAVLMHRESKAASRESPPWSDMLKLTP